MANTRRFQSLMGKVYILIDCLCMLLGVIACGARMSACFVLFCFVWLATLGVPVVAPGTAAGPFRRVVEAPFWVPSSPVVERGALSTEVPPHLKRGEVPGHCRPGHHVHGALGLSEGVGGYERCQFWAIVGFGEKE